MTYYIDDPELGRVPVISEEDSKEAAQGKGEIIDEKLAGLETPVTDDDE